MGLIREAEASRSLRKSKEGVFHQAEAALRSGFLFPARRVNGGKTAERVLLITSEKIFAKNSWITSCFSSATYGNVLTA